MTKTKRFADFFEKFAVVAGGVALFQGNVLWGGLCMVVFLALSMYLTKGE